MRRQKRRRSDEGGRETVPPLRCMVLRKRGEEGGTFRSHGCHMGCHMHVTCVSHILTRMPHSLTSRLARMRRAFLVSTSGIDPSSSSSSTAAAEPLPPPLTPFRCLPRPLRPPPRTGFVTPPAGDRHGRLEPPRAPLPPSSSPLPLSVSSSSSSSSSLWADGEGACA